MKLSYLLLGSKNGFNLMYDEYFTTSYIIDTIPNLPAVHQLTTQYNKNLWIIVIYGGDPITCGFTS